MFIEYKFYVGARDINPLKQLTNTSLLSYLEDVGCMHSEFIGYGITNMETVKKTWVLLSWKVKVLKRPKFSDVLNVKTWSRKVDRFYAYRDFNVYDENNEVIAIATSKWVFIDIEKGKIIKIPDEISEKYKQENICVFEKEDIEKIKEPEQYINKIDYKITKNMIDVNKHLHNIYYMDIAKEVLPEEISFINESNEFEIMYKHEIKLGDIVKAMYSKIDEYHYVVIKNEEENLTHAIIRLK